MALNYSDADLPPFRGIDPLHPLVEDFSGEVEELNAWTRKVLDRNGIYRTVRSELVKDPGPVLYLYIFGGKPDRGDDTLYVGITRNPHIRFAQHRRRSHWWNDVTDAVVHRIDCRWHEPPACSVSELDKAGRRLETWMIELLEPSENRALGRVD